MENLDINNRKAAHIAKTLLEQFGTRAGRTYLDVGCGSGGAARYIAQQLQLIVTGIDADSEEIILAQKESSGLKNLTFRTADAEDLPFDDSLFDFIFCCKAMHHFPHWRAALNEMVRVLKPTGYLFVSDLSLPYCWEFMKERFRGKLGPFPRRKQVQTEATELGLHEKILTQRIGEYDIAWQKWKHLDKRGVEPR